MTKLVQQVGVWNGQSIPTFYSGNTFRSRLEARWAVFMDQLGVRWFYEYEGFELPSGRYVPDFWLPDIDRWLEIKPVSFDPWGKDAGGRDAKRCSEFMQLADKSKGLVILCGSPAEQEDDLNESWYQRESGFVMGDYHYLWCRCPGCGAYGIEFDGRGERACRKDICSSGSKSYTPDDPSIIAAKAVAMTWRFH